MTESGHASSRLGPSPTHGHHARHHTRRRHRHLSRLGPSPTHELHDRHRVLRRRCIPCCLISLPILLALIITTVTLAFTVFKPRDPRATLVSATVSGISPRVTLPAVSIDLNVTLDLEILVVNPNYAPFAHEPGTSLLLYRGAQVGEANVAAGRIPSRGSDRVRARMTVEGGKITAEVGSLIRDVMAGEVGLETRTMIPGKVTFLGFITRHAVAMSECHVVVGLLRELRVTSQDCKPAEDVAVRECMGSPRGRWIGLIGS